MFGRLPASQVKEIPAMEFYNSLDVGDVHYLLGKAVTVSEKRASNNPHFSGVNYMVQVMWFDKNDVLQFQRFSPAEALIFLK